MKKLKAVKQRDLTDCGAACLRSIMGFYGIHIPVSRIRQHACTDQHGTNVLGLIEAAETFGFSARGAKGNEESLGHIPTPAIAHVVLPGGLHHYVVLCKSGKRKVRYMDPAEGKFISISTEKFIGLWSGIIVMFSPQTGICGNKSLSVYGKFLQLAKPHRGAMIQLFFGAIVYTLLGLSTSIYLQKLIDDVIENGNIQLLHLLGSVMVLLLLMQIIIGFIRSVIALKTGQSIDARLISGYYRHLFELPQRFFDTMRVGEVMSRVSDAIKIRLFLNEIFLGIMVNFLVVLFSVAIMVIYYWKLALLVLSAFPLYWLLYFITDRINQKWQRKLMEQAADLESTIVEGLQNAGSVKKFNLSRYIVAKTEDRFLRLLQSGYRAGLFNLWTGTGSDLINKMLVILILWIGGYYVLNRELSPGALLSFYSLVGYFTAPVAALIASGKGVQDAYIAADRLFEILDLELEKDPDRPMVEIKGSGTGDIEFKNVCFRYGTRNIVFDNLSFIIKKGEIAAIVGESGCGKSTIISLMQNLYPLKDGQIRIGEIPIEHYDIDGLRTKIGVVPQQIDLFSGTIIENIALGDPSPKMERIVRLCQVVGAADFIEAMPENYLSKVGEKGSNLSGGQKQKLAIARALYRDPEILILDESTANLDPLSESKIQLLLANLKAAGKTIIIVAHRLSTVKNADTIFVLQKGRLAESGKHLELMEREGLYHQLWHSN